MWLVSEDELHVIDAGEIVGFSITPNVMSTMDYGRNLCALLKNGMKITLITISYNRLSTYNEKRKEDQAKLREKRDEILDKISTLRKMGPDYEDVFIFCELEE